MTGSPAVDHVTLTIKDSNNVTVLTVDGYLDSSNHQARPDVKEISKMSRNKMQIASAAARRASVVIAAALFAAGGGGSTVFADPPQKKVTVCHRTGSTTNPWVERTVSSNAHEAPDDFVVTPSQPCPPAGGESFGTLSARWWQFVEEFPEAPNPLVEQGPVDCSRGQAGSVWFLVGVPRTTPPTELTGASRTCEIPSGKTLFFPLVNATFINEPGDCDRPAGCTVAEKRQRVNEFVDRCTVSSTLDGVQQGMVRAQSPTFDVTVGPTDVYGIPEGTRDSAAVSDGFWILLDPLPPGEHQLQFEGLCTAPEFFAFEVIYDLTVAP
jgi:hypothetical protein